MLNEKEQEKAITMLYYKQGLPNCCIECIFCRNHGEYFECLKSGEKTPFDSYEVYNTLNTSRKKDCPLQYMIRGVRKCLKSCTV